MEEECFTEGEEQCPIEVQNIENIPNSELEKVEPEVGRKSCGLQIECVENKRTITENIEPSERADVTQNIQESLNGSGNDDIKNLMNTPIEEILATFPEHKIYLTKLYGKHIKQVKRNYKPKDIPDFIALDIVNTAQFEQMVTFLEEKLVRNAVEEHNCLDIIFDSIIPEWALRIFCVHFGYARAEAVQRLKMQLLLTNDSETLS